MNQAMGQPEQIDRNNDIAYKAIIKNIPSEDLAEEYELAPSRITAIVQRSAKDSKFLKRYRDKAIAKASIYAPDAVDNIIGIAKDEDHKDQLQANKTVLTTAGVTNTDSERPPQTINIDKLGIMVGSMCGMPALDTGDDTTVSPDTIDVTPDK